MTREEIELLKSDDLDPIYLNLFGVKGCQEALLLLHFPTDSRPLGLDYWLQTKIRKGKNDDI